MLAASRQPRGIQPYHAALAGPRYDRGDAQLRGLLHDEIHALRRAPAPGSSVTLSGDSRSMARCASMRTRTPRRSIATMQAAYSPPRPSNSVSASPARERSTRATWVETCCGQQPGIPGLQRRRHVAARQAHARSMPSIATSTIRSISDGVMT